MGAESKVPAADMGALYEALRVKMFPLDRQGLYYKLLHPNGCAVLDGVFGGIPSGRFPTVIV